MECDKSTILEWVLESPEEPKFEVGEHVLYACMDTTVLKYDGSDNTYQIHWFTRDIWVNECELDKIN